MALYRIKMTQKNEEENYIVQEFDKDVQCEGIPSKVYLHVGLIHLIVGNKMMSLNSFSFIFTNIQMQSKLAGRLSLTLIYFNDLNKAKLREKDIKK